MKSSIQILLFTISLASAVSFAEPTPQEQQAITNLSEYDRNLIGHYTSLGYSVNKALPNYVDSKVDPTVKVSFDAEYPPSNLEELDTSMANAKYVFQLNRTLSKMPNYTQTVYRGIYSSVKPETRFVKNTISIERRFNSSTTSSSVADDFARGKDKNTTCGACSPDVVDPNPQMMVVLEIEPKTGRNISALNEEEKEVLFPYGVIFKTKDVYRETKRKIKAPCTQHHKVGICEYTGFLVVKMEELVDANMSADDKANLEKSEKLRTQGLIKNYFGGDIQNFKQTITRTNKLFEQWNAQGHSLADEDVNFDEGND